MKIRIHDIPPGEAPEDVRKAWVGLELPTKGGISVFQTAQVISGPKSPLGRFIAQLFGRLRLEKGYAVETIVAIEILKQKSPEAANWWIENTPHLLMPGKHLVFISSVCEPVLW